GEDQADPQRQPELRVRQDGAEVGPAHPLGRRYPGDLRQPVILQGELRDLDGRPEQQQADGDRGRQQQLVRRQAAAPDEHRDALSRTEYIPATGTAPAGPAGEAVLSGPGILPGWPETVLTMRRLTG